jgi:hypothetical protein
MYTADFYNLALILVSISIIDGNLSAPHSHLLTDFTFLENSFRQV